MESVNNGMRQLKYYPYAPVVFMGNGFVSGAMPILVRGTIIEVYRNEKQHTGGQSSSKSEWEDWPLCSIQEGIRPTWCLNYNN
jgi:hypothetical protein